MLHTWSRVSNVELLRMLAISGAMNENFRFRRTWPRAWVCSVVFGNAAEHFISIYIHIGGESLMYATERYIVSTAPTSTTHTCRRTVNQ
jgi:hypothetical protein